MLSRFWRKKATEAGTVVPQWVTIEEGLPEDGARVMVGVENGNVCHPMHNCCHQDGKWFNSDGKEICTGVDVYKWKLNQ